MTITGIKVRKLLPEGRLKSVVSVTFDNEFAVHDIKVVEGSSRLFVAMPSRRDEHGAFKDIVHPITPKMREELEECVLSAYREALLHVQDEENRQAPQQNAQMHA